MPHIRHGCIGDSSPDSCAMEIGNGRSRDGLDRTRSFKGTNNVENFHKVFKDVLSSFRTSLSLAHSVMLPSTPSGTFAWQVRPLVCLEMSTSGENLRCTGEGACLVNEKRVFYKHLLPIGRSTCSGKCRLNSCSTCVCIVQYICF